MGVPKSKPEIIPTWVHPGQEVDPSAWDCGAVLVDKPQDWTSFDVVAKLRGAIKIKKVAPLYCPLYPANATLPQFPIVAEEMRYSS
jgi:hypothetical protein